MPPTHSFRTSLICVEEYQAKYPNSFGIFEAVDFHTVSATSYSRRPRQEGMFFFFPITCWKKKEKKKKLFCL